MLTFGDQGALGFSRLHFCSRTLGYLDEIFHQWVGEQGVKVRDVSDRKADLELRHRGNVNQPTPNSFHPHFVVLCVAKAMKGRGVNDPRLYRHAWLMMDSSPKSDNKSKRPLASSGSMGAEARRLRLIMSRITAFRE